MTRETSLKAQAQTDGGRRVNKLRSVLAFDDSALGLLIFVHAYPFALQAHLHSDDHFAEELATVDASVGVGKTVEGEH